MDIFKALSKIAKAMSKHTDINVITDYNTSRVLLKFILAMPETYVVNLDIADPDWNGYDNAYLISITDEYGVYCSPAVYEGTKYAARSTGLFYIDKSAIGDYEPEDFVLDENSEIKVVGDK